MTPKPAGRDKRILHALLIERRSCAQIARDENITRTRIGQILAERYGIRIRPVMVIDNPEAVKAELPEWEPRE